jgi:hypothetical protein
VVGGALKRFKINEIRQAVTAIVHDCQKYHAIIAREVYHDQEKQEIVVIPCGGSDERLMRADPRRFQLVGVYDKRLDKASLIGDLNSLREA